MAAPPLRPSVAGIAYRTATPDDLVACAGIWRDSINDYTRRLNQPDIPDDLAAILRLYDHLHATDPDGFVVAEQAVDGATAGRRGVRRARTGARTLWFLSMLFVLPERPGARAWAGRCSPKVMPPPGRGGVLATSHGQRPADLERAVRVARDRARGCRSSGSSGCRSGTATCRTLPRGVERGAVPTISTPRRPPTSTTSWPRSTGRRAGFEHLVDHGFVRAEGRAGVLFVDGGGRAVGYGYASEAGRVGPIAVRDAELLTPGDRPAAADGRAARRVRDLDAGRGGRGDDGAAPGRLPGRRLPVPRLLGPAARRLLALRADLARPAVAPTR